MDNTLNTPRGLTMALGNAALVLTAGATTFSLTGFSYAINGKAYTKATVGAGTGDTPNVDANTGVAFKVVPANSACALLWCVDAAGAVKLAQGPIVALGANDVFVDVPQLPDVPANTCPFAYVVIKNAADAATFTVDTTNWNAANVTATPVSLITLPARPQTA